MRERITSKKLEAQVLCLNELTGNPVTPWAVNKETGEWEPQAYAYVLDGAYGGFELQQMCRTGSGCTEPLNTGHIPARELSGLLGVMIKTIELMQTRHHSVRNWMALPDSELVVDIAQLSDFR